MILGLDTDSSRWLLETAMFATCPDCGESKTSIHPQYGHMTYNCGYSRGHGITSTPCRLWREAGFTSTLVVPASSTPDVDDNTTPWYGEIKHLRAEVARLTRQVSIAVAINSNLQAEKTKLVERESSANSQLGRCVEENELLQESLKQRAHTIELQSQSLFVLGQQNINLTEENKSLREQIIGVTESQRQNVQLCEELKELDVVEREYNASGGPAFGQRFSRNQNQELLNENAKLREEVKELFDGNQKLLQVLEQRNATIDDHIKESKNRSLPLPWHLPGHRPSGQSGQLHEKEEVQRSGRRTAALRRCFVKEKALQEQVLADLSLEGLRLQELLQLKQVLIDALVKDKQELVMQKNAAIDALVKDKQELEMQRNAVIDNSQSQYSKLKDERTKLAEHNVSLAEQNNKLIEELSEEKRKVVRLFSEKAEERKKCIDALRGHTLVRDPDAKSRQELFEDKQELEQILNQRNAAIDGLNEECSKWKDENAKLSELNTFAQSCIADGEKQIKALSDSLAKMTSRKINEMTFEAKQKLNAFAANGVTPKKPSFLGWLFRD